MSEVYSSALPQLLRRCNPTPPLTALHLTWYVMCSVEARLDIFQSQLFFSQLFTLQASTSPWCVCFLCQSYIFHGDSALSLDWFLTLVWRQMMNGAIKVCVLLRWGAGYNSDFISPERSAADEAVTWHIQHGFCSVLRCWMRKWQIQWSSSPERGSTHSRFGACGSFYHQLWHVTVQQATVLYTHPPTHPTTTHAPVKAACFTKCKDWWKLKAAESLEALERRVVWRTAAQTQRKPGSWVTLSEDINSQWKQLCRVQNTHGFHLFLFKKLFF